MRVRKFKVFSILQLAAVALSLCISCAAQVDPNVNTAFTSLTVRVEDVPDGMTLVRAFITDENKMQIAAGSKNANSNSFSILFPEKFLGTAGRIGVEMSFHGLPFYANDIFIGPIGSAEVYENEKGKGVVNSTFLPGKGDTYTIRVNTYTMGNAPGGFQLEDILDSLPIKTVTVNMPPNLPSGFTPLMSVVSAVDKNFSTSIPIAAGVPLHDGSNSFRIVFPTAPTESTLRVWVLYAKSGDIGEKSEDLPGGFENPLGESAAGLPLWCTYTDIPSSSSQADVNPGAADNSPVLGRYITKNLPLSAYANLSLTNSEYLSDDYLILENYDETVPLGWVPFGSADYPFNGHIYGLNHKIGNITFEAASTLTSIISGNSVGIFGATGNLAGIEDITFEVNGGIEAEGMPVSGTAVYAGLLAGRIEGSHFKNIGLLKTGSAGIDIDIWGSYDLYAGSIAGLILVNAEIDFGTDNLTLSSPVSASSVGNVFAGALFGKSDSTTVLKCGQLSTTASAKVAVKKGSNVYAGGLAGSLDYHDNSTFSGPVSIAGDVKVGDENSFPTGTVHAGGVAGDLQKQQSGSMSYTVSSSVWVKSAGTVYAGVIGGSIVPGGIPGGSFNSTIHIEGPGTKSVFLSELQDAVLELGTDTNMGYNLTDGITIDGNAKIDGACMLPFDLTISNGDTILSGVMGVPILKILRVLPNANLIVAGSGELILNEGADLILANPSQTGNLLVHAGGKLNFGGKEIIGDMGLHTPGDVSIGGNAKVSDDISLWDRQFSFTQDVTVRSLIVLGWGESIQLGGDMYFEDDESGIIFDTTGLGQAPPAFDTIPNQIIAGSPGVKIHLGTNARPHFQNGTYPYQHSLLIDDTIYEWTGSIWDASGPPAPGVLNQK